MGALADRIWDHDCPTHEDPRGFAPRAALKEWAKWSGLPISGLRPGVIGTPPSLQATFHASSLRSACYTIILLILRISLATDP